MTVHWTAQQDEIIVTRLKQDATLEAIGREIGRSASAISSRLHAIGLRASDIRPALSEHRKCKHCQTAFVANHRQTIRCEECRKKKPPGNMAKRIKPKAGEKRRCLMCSDQFWSLGSFNRICKNCRQTKDWQDGEVVAV